MRISALTGLTFLIALATVPAQARGLPGPTVTDGPNCHALSRATGQDTLFVGTVLGGQDRPGKWGDGTFRDYRTFQGCFVSEVTCQEWVVRHAMQRPMPPAYGRCTRVFVGLTPDGGRPMREPVVRTKY